MHSQPLIIIPTVNEGSAIQGLLLEILLIPLVEVLVVDDASQDATRREVLAVAEAHPGRVYTLFREEACGIGSAYLAGFHWALDRSYSAVIQMDGDGSHEPRFLVNMLEALKENPMVVGSRYVDGARVEDTYKRQAYSRFANILARRCIGEALRDMTGGFNGWHRDLLDCIIAKPFFSRGHAFQMELKSRALQEQIGWKEIPITFKPRKSGRSKLRWRHFGESLRLLAELRKNRGLRA